MPKFLLLKQPINEDKYMWLGGKCEIYKSANSDYVKITTDPVFVDYNRNIVSDIQTSCNFQELDPYTLELISEIPISGCPCYNEEYKAYITFNAWYIS